MIEKPTGMISFDQVVSPADMTAFREAWLKGEFWQFERHLEDGHVFTLVLPRWHLFGRPVGRRTITATWTNLKEAP